MPRGTLPERLRAIFRARGHALLLYATLLDPAEEVRRGITLIHPSHVLARKFENAGSFVLMDFPNPADADVVHIDSLAGDLFLESEADLRRYRLLFEHLRAVASSPDQSTSILATLTTIESRCRDVRGRLVRSPLAQEH